MLLLREVSMMSPGAVALLDPIHQRREELVLLARRRLVGIAREFWQRHGVVLAAAV